MILSPRTAITIEGNRPVGGAAPSTLLTGLTSYWKFDETSGTRADSVGTNHLLEVGGSTGSAAGIISNAAAFTGVVGRSLRIASNASISPASSFTFSTWFFKAAGGFFDMFVTKSNGATTPVSYMLRENGGGDSIMVIVEDGVGGASTTAGVPYTNGAWHLAVWGWDAGDGKAFLYVDNGSVAQGGVIAGVRVDATYPLMFGNYSPSDNLPLTGRTDESGLWNARVLTALERAELWNGGAGKTWPFV